MLVSKTAIDPVACLVGNKYLLNASGQVEEVKKELSVQLSGRSSGSSNRSQLP